MYRYLIKLSVVLIGRDLARGVYRNAMYGESNPVGGIGLLLTPIVRLLISVRGFSSFAAAAREEASQKPTRYDWSRINQSLSSVLELPDVVISGGRKKTVNVLVPAFSVNTMSAGFFGVFQVALMIARHGYHVRLVLFDKFPFSFKSFQGHLKNYPGLHTLVDEVEVEHIGEKHLLYVSKDDVALATVWYSAYFARKIVQTLGSGPFIYLIQDYEAAFFPASSLYSLADATYEFDYHALVSTKPLYDYLQVHSRTFGTLARSGRALWFNNACAAGISDRATFLSSKSSQAVRRLAFYCRPTVSRNMFELGAAALIKAWRTGAFNTGDKWELYGIGIGQVEIVLGEGVTLRQLPRMSLAEYSETIKTFDVCLSLMASPHPSITPFDLAGVGAIVITNSYECKSVDYFASISPNIICVSPFMDDIVDGIKSATERVRDLSGRWENARGLHYPRQWAETWQDEHLRFVERVCGVRTSSEVMDIASAELFKA